MENNMLIYQGVRMGHFGPVLPVFNSVEGFAAAVAFAAAGDITE